METPISDFDYRLPQKLIAQTPARPRETARLMVVHRATGTLEHKLVSNLPDYFRPGDLVVVNDTKVFRARLDCTITGAGNTYPRGELFLVRPVGNGNWLAIGKPGKKFRPGAKISIADDFSCTVDTAKSDGSFTVSFGGNPAAVITRADTYGHVPVPPYIRHEPDLKTYQTSYAKVTGSVAAPTAGFHMTETIRKKLAGHGVEIRELTLHVGLGTFIPVKSDTLETHTMHSEWVHVPKETANAVNRAKSQHRRVIAVGTTTVRTLEGVAAEHDGNVTAYTGDIGLFIRPGFRFRVIDGMLTNFHLPKSTLLVLVSAFAGREHILAAYHQAVRRRYRFYSFGDAMLIV